MLAELRLIVRINFSYESGENLSKTKKYNILSWICFIVCMILWVPNIVFQISSPFWMLVYILGPLGIIFGVMNKNVLLIILNSIMCMSFFIFMAIGYYVSSF